MLCEDWGEKDVSPALSAGYGLLLNVPGGLQIPQTIDDQSLGAACTFRD